jgi:anti-anti-sigma regulatory factor
MPEGTVVSTQVDDVTIEISDENAVEHLAVLRRELQGAVLAGAVWVVVDVSRVRRLSSGALAALLCVHRQCRARGGGVVVRSSRRGILELLHRHHLHRIFLVEDTSGCRPGTGGTTRSAPAGGPS